MKKIVSVILAIITFISTLVIPIDVEAACDYYVDVTAEKVNLFTQPYKDSTKVKSVYEGDVLHIKDENINSYGNKWLLSDSGWIYSAHVKKHTHKGVMCGKGSTTYESISEKEHIKKLYSGDDLCRCGYKVGSGATTTKKESHSFEHGKCKDCDFVFNRVLKENRVYVKIKENCSCFSEPTKNSTKLGSLSAGENVLTIGTVINEYGNTWFKNEDGSYFFSGHIDHEHSGSMCGQTNTSYELYSDIEHYKHTYNGDILCRCGFKIENGTTSTIAESHNFVQGVCTSCGFIFNRVFTENKAWAQLKEDCHSYSGPSKDSGKKDYYVAGDDILTLGTIINEHNNTWYKLDDGSFIFEGHIDHMHSGLNCGQGWNEYQQNSDDTHITFSNDGGEYCSCGFQTKENSVTQFEEAHNFDGKTFCSECGYCKEVESEDASIDDTESQTDVSYETDTEDIEDNSVDYEETESDNESTDEKNDEEPYEGDDNSEEFICVNYEDCTANDSKIYIITDDNCPIRERPHLFGKVVANAKEGQLISVKDVSWKLLSLSRWAELNVSGTNKKYYIHISNIELHDTHNYVNALTTNKGSVDFCSVCGVGKATLQNESTICDLTCVLDQTVKGSFSEEQTSFISVISQIIVGEIPGLGTLADCRDILGDIMNGEPLWVIAMDCVALLPLVGMLKYTDEIGIITKNADEIIAAAKHGDTLTDASKYIPWGKWEDYKKVVIDGEEYAQIGNFYYRKHAVEEFLNPSIETNWQVKINPNGKKSWVEHSRGIPPSYVDWMLTEGVENGTTIIGEPYIRNGGTHVKYTNGSLEVVLREGEIVYTIFTK